MAYANEAVSLACGVITPHQLAYFLQGRDVDLMHTKNIENSKTNLCL